MNGLGLNICRTSCVPPMKDFLFPPQNFHLHVAEHPTPQTDPGADLQPKQSQYFMGPRGASLASVTSSVQFSLLKHLQFTTKDITGRKIFTS